MFKRKLWKRVLPVILSVAMVLETVPATALAAEYEENEKVAETALEENEPNDERGDMQDENAQDDAQNEAGNVSEDDDAADAEKTTTEDASKESDGTDTDDDKEELVAKDEENAAAALDTKIVVDEKMLANDCNNSSSSYKYDIDKKVILVKYDEQNSDPFGSLLARMKSSYISVEVDGTTNNTLIESLNYQWQKTDGTSLAAGAVPTDAGDYTLVISLDAVDSVCSKAERKIPFTISKRQLFIALSDEYVVPGTTVGALKAKLDYTLNKETTDWYTESTEDLTETKDSYIDTVSFVVYDAYQTDTALADEEKLLEGKDYVVSVRAALKQSVSSNYEIPEETVLRLKSYERIETWIEAVQKKPEELISNVYDETKEKQISYETEIKDKLTATVNVYDEEANENIVLDEAVVTEVWYDAAKQELGEGAEFEPKAAGTYYLGFRYYPTEEDANIYKVCEDSAFIRVVIEKAPLTLVPKLKSDAEVFYTGMAEADVLKYADYTLLNAANAEVQIDRDTFWGVSYDDVNNNTTNTRQSYEPVFQLIRAEKDASGNPVKDETTGKEVWTENDNDLLDASKYCYRLVFTGKKAVYKNTGALGTLKDKEISVNGSDVDAEDKNHSIVITPEALSANYAEVSVAEAQKTTIDVSGILQENFNTTNLNDLYSPTKLVSKVYDGEALYAPSRGEYKKAVVTAADGEEAAKNYDAAIKYTWYRINSVKAVYDETDPENRKQMGWEVLNKSAMSGNTIPTAAGEYMLEIRFAKTGYVSCTETIYYRIDKQLLIVDVEKIPEAFKNESVSSYTSAVHYDGDYNVYVVPDNQYSEAVKTEANLLQDWYKISFYDDLDEDPYGRYYKLNWYVEQLQLDENNNPVKDEDGNAVYTELNSYDALSVSGTDIYRLGVRLETRNTNYTNYEIIYDAEKKPTPAYTTKNYNNIVNITVSEKEAGATPITIEFDAEKIIATKNYDGTPFYATEEQGWNSIQGAITVKNAETGETIAQDQWPFLQYNIYDNSAEESYSSVAFDEMVYGGTYTLSLYALSDETYQFAYLDNAAEYTIHKRALTVTPVLMEDIPAGTNVRSSNDGVIYNLSKTEFAGYVEADAEAFQYGTSVYIDNTKTLGFGAYAYVEDGEPRYNTLSAAVSKAGDANKYSGYIKYGKEYTVQFAGELAYPYSRNYDVEYVRKPFQATRRGNATVDSNYFPKNRLDYFVKTDLAQRNEGTTVTITPVKPIPYIKAPTLPHTDAFGNVIQKEGNYFEFEIQAPKEFFEDSDNCGKYRDDFLYRSSIEAAGGYVLETFEGLTNEYSNTNECIVVFPVEEKTVKKFEIIWETGYTEQFVIDFTNAVLKEDLTKAVAPKNLSFNGVNTKMAVGDEQQLDVKIKKAQISDIIYIDYQVVQGSDVISVTSDDSKGASGYVTALKPGKATVAAVPVKLVNGVKTKIEGAKEAKVSITVSDVTAPAIKKVTGTDKKVAFTYVKPTNGYRREVYILAGKKKAEDFETLIRSMNNGQWRGVFTVQPQYYANESVDAKKITNEMNISGLPANGEYTIYVRNVSGIRTLEDGSCVQLSAKGTVKSFKTTKPQVEALRLYAKNDTDSFITTKNVKLTDKTEQLYTQGRFSTIDIDPAADAADKSWLTLPLDKAYSKTFVAPKLVYGVTSDLNEVDVSDIRDFRNYTYISGRYYKKTDIATVDKKGKVTFKGVGKVYVIVYDQIEKQKKAQVTLNIYANADSIKAKDAKLAVGKRVYLSSLLTYYEGKTVISGMDYQNTGIIGTSYKPNLTIPAETVSKINSEGNFVVAYTGDGDYSITALKPNAVCEITAKDGTLPVSLKIQSTPIEPVKELKVTDMVDNGFLIGISFSVDTAPETWHRIDITDERGNVVASESWGSTATNTGYDGKKKVYTQVFEDDVHKQDKWRYTSSKITRLSKYNVSVTTVIGDETSAKPVTKSVKTTDFPASHWDLATNEYGGMAITAYSLAGTKENSAVFSLSSRKYLTSGNAYTLRVAVDASAQYRMTDTLTWKSTNTKVASVKPKAGTYTAQLNALKPGSTVIEVTSKITKKVIARWPVFVKSVGNAKDCYYGDYEYAGEYKYTHDPNYTGTVEVLTLQNAVRVTASEIYDEYTNNSITSSNYKWVKFTAPAFGRYSFNCSKSVFDMVSSLKGTTVKYPGNSSAITMVEGETLYFRVQGTFTMSVSDYVKQGTSFTVDDGSVLIDDDSKQLIAFHSTEDNVYTFYSKELPSLSMKIYNEQLSTQTSKTQIDEGIRKYDVSLSMGETIYLEVPAGNYSIYVEKRNAAALGDSAALSLTNAVNGWWYIYTASASGLYTFKSKDATSALTIAYYKSLKDFDPTAWSITTDGNDFTGRMTLEEGDKVVFNIRADEAATATIIVTPEIPVNLAVGEEKELPVNADSRKWAAFQLPAAGRYQFSAVSIEDGAAYDVNLRYFKNAIEENEITTIEKNEIIVSDIPFSNANNKPDTAVGDTVYAEITTTKEGTEAANVKVSLTQVTATELMAGEEQTITVKNGEERWYTFTAPETKKYIVQSVVTPNTADDGTATDTHKLTAGYYENGLEQRTQTHLLGTIGEYDFYKEYSGKIGSTYTFKISADDLGLGADGTEITTTAKIIVKELTATPLEMGKTEEISLLKNERKWYTFTAPETDLYIFESKAIEGKFSLPYGDSIDSTSSVGNINNGYDGVELEKGQTIYIETRAFQGVAAKFTLLVRLPNKLSGTVEEKVTVTSETPAYYMYTADAYTRYAISYTVDTPDAQANVYHDASVSVSSVEGNRIRNHYIDLPLEENEVRHIKVDTTSEIPVTVTLQIAPIEPIKLSVGTTENIAVGACEEMTNDPKYTWCSFTAPETGRYTIAKTSSDASIMEFYDHITDSDKNENFDKNYYEAGETVYVALYTEKDQDLQTSIEVGMIQIVPVEGGSVNENITIDNQKEYSYTAQKTGLYTFTNESSSPALLYMDITDDESVSVDSQESKTIFLKEKDIMYISATSSTGYPILAKFTIALEDEPQKLSEENKPVAIEYNGKDAKLIAFTAQETALYNFEIVYSTERGAGYDDDVYYMNHSQILWENSALFSSEHGRNVGEDAGKHKVYARMLLEGETGYLYIPSIQADAIIEASKFAEEPVVKTLKVNESKTHAFRMEEKEEVDEDGNITKTQVGERIWYVFDAPEDGDYTLTFKKEGTFVSYKVQYFRNGLNQLSFGGEYRQIKDNESFDITGIKRKQRVCFVITKEKGSLNAQQLTITVTKKQ